MESKDLLQITDNLEEELIKIFRVLHQNPELSNEEFETTSMIKKLLNDAGIEILNTNLKTGVIAKITGKDQGPVIAIRCDIDALPIEEETTLEYKSKINGKMHACGHDFHTAAILGAAYLLKREQNLLNGTVKFIFQPGEESGDGAIKVLNTGLLSDVSVIFGIHSIPDARVGTIAVKDGAMTAAVDRFEINILGVGSHAARPEKSVDPIIIAANIMAALQTIVSRNISPKDKALLSITHIEAGNTWNVIPESAYMEGTVRTLSEHIRELIPKRMEGIIKGIANAYGGSASLSWHSGSPATNNDDDWTDFSIKLAKNMNFRVKKMSMGLEGEDFAYYQKTHKGVFITVGTGISHAHHHPKFMVDEKALINASRYFASIGKESINQLLIYNTEV